MISIDTLLAGRYRLKALLGRGGMADVYVARDELLERSVAVKILRGAAADEGLRFTSEMRVLSRLSHPGVVHLYDAGEHAEVPYLVMELVEGHSLAERLAGAGALDHREVRRIGRSLAEALAHAHAADIVHRDVKPSNVLIEPTGRVRLADFGIARAADATRLTVTGKTIGTAAYISPEQLRGEQAGPPADVYSLGLVLLECLTGVKEFTGTPIEAAMARLHRDPNVPAALQPPWPDLLLTMTASDPAGRPTASEVGARLAAVPAATQPAGDRHDSVAAAPVLVGGTSRWPRGGRQRANAAAPRARLLGVAAVAVLLLVAAVFAAVAAEPAADDGGEPANLREALEQLEESVEP